MARCRSAFVRLEGAQQERVTQSAEPAHGPALKRRGDERFEEVAGDVVRPSLAITSKRSGWSCGKLPLALLPRQRAVLWSRTIASVIILDMCCSW